MKTRMIKRCLAIVLFFAMPGMMFAESVSMSNEKDSLSVEAQQMVDVLKDLPMAYRNFVTDILLKCEKVGDEVVLTLPSGETITMNFDNENSIEKFWKTVMDKNKVTEICNVPFGSSYESTKEALENKFGDYSYILSTKDNLVYKKKRYGGILFDRIYFFFQSDGRKTFFNGALFVLECKNKHDAIERKKEFHEMMAKRYINLKNIDNGDNYMSVGGLAPIPTNATSGFGFYIDVLKYDDNTIENRYAARIAYGPYEFVKEEF